MRYKIFIIGFLIIANIFSAQAISKQQATLVQNYESRNLEKFKKTLSKTSIDFVYKNEPFAIYLLKNKESDYINLLLENDLSCAIKDSNDANILMWAVKLENLEVVKKLVDKGNLDFSKGLIVDSVSQEFCGSIMCQAAASLSDTATMILELLINAGGNVNETELDAKHKESYITPIWYAVANRDLKKFDLLIKNHADVNQKDEYSLLMNVAERGDLDFTKLLIANGADYKAEVEYQYSKNAIAFAAQKGHLDIVKYYDSLDSMLTKSSIPLQAAIDGKQEAVIEFLLNKNIEFEDFCLDNRASSIQNSVFRQQDTALFFKLVEKGMPIKSNCHLIKDYTFSLLNCNATSPEQLVMAKYCLEKGVEPLAQSLGENALELALKNGNSELVKLMCKYISEISETDFKHYVDYAKKQKSGDLSNLLNDELSSKIK